MKAYLVVRPGQDVAEHEQALARAGYAVWRVSEPPLDVDEVSLVVFVRDSESQVMLEQSHPHSPLAGLRGSQKELIQALFDYVPVMIDVFDSSWNMVWVNREFERVMGYRLDEIRGHEVMSVFYPDATQRRRAEENIIQGSGVWQEFETTLRNGKKLHTAWSNLRLSDGTIIGIGQDITARKQAEQLRTRFIEESIQAQEEERRRLALELHDEMGQSLATLLLGLKALEEDLDEGEALRQVRVLREITAQSVREVGRLARGLRPTALDDLGFPAAIEAHVAEVERTHLLRVDLHMDGFNDRARMPTRIENHLYRMVQEALTNVIKHARASSVSVVLRRNYESVLAIVEDDGAGFDSPEMPRHTGPHDELKLTSIRERAALLGGSISIESVAGHGTTLYIHVPLPQEP